MQTIQHGAGDPITWGSIVSPADPRFEDQSYTEDAVQAVADSLFDLYLARPDRISDAAERFTFEEMAAIDCAHARRDAMAMFAVRDAAVQRVLKEMALEDARADFEKMEREIESDAIAELLS